MNNTAIEARLSVVAEHNEVWATLEYTNSGSLPVYLEKINGCLNGVVENDVFEIAEGGEAVKYIGILAKRQAPGPEAFSEMPAGKRLATKVRLDAVYDFAPGRHVYRARYSALHPFPNRPGFFDLKSNETEFEFVRGK